MNIQIFKIPDLSKSFLKTFDTSMEVSKLKKPEIC